MWGRRRFWLVGLALLAVGFSGCDWTMIGFKRCEHILAPDTSLNATNVPDLALAFNSNTGGEVLGFRRERRALH